MTTLGSGTIKFFEAAISKNRQQYDQLTKAQIDDKKLPEITKRHYINFSCKISGSSHLNQLYFKDESAILDIR